MNVKCGFRPLWTAGTERLQSDSKVAGYIISVWGFKEGMLLCSSCSHLHQGSARNRRIPWLWLQLCDGSALSKETTTHSLSPPSFLLFYYSNRKSKGRERERALPCSAGNSSILPIEFRTIQICVSVSWPSARIPFFPLIGCKNSLTDVSRFIDSVSAVSIRGSVQCLRCGCLVSYTVCFASSSFVCPAFLYKTCPLVMTSSNTSTSDTTRRHAQIQKAKVPSWQNIVACLPAGQFFLFLFEFDSMQIARLASAVGSATDEGREQSGLLVEPTHFGNLCLWCADARPGGRRKKKK